MGVSENSGPPLKRSIRVPFKGSYMGSIGFRVWEFPKIRGALCWGPYNKAPTISGTILGSPISETPVLVVIQTPKLGGFGHSKL